jgi:hypothetical protein
MGFTKIACLGLVVLFSASALADDSPCVVLKRMGPADEVTSHLYSFGLRGKQYQYVEGMFPKGMKFHGRLTDKDVREIFDKGGRIAIVEPRYASADLQQARETCHVAQEQKSAPVATPVAAKAADQEKK